MTTITINITNIGAPGGTNSNRAATYTLDTTTTPPPPSWAAVAEDGDIHLEEAPNQGAIVIEWNLPEEGELSFADSAPFSAPSAPPGLFNAPAAGGAKSLQVTDNNNSPPDQKYEYTLTLNDGSQLDPKFINK